MTDVDTTRELALLREELQTFRASRQAEELGLGAKSISRAEILRGLLAAVAKTGGEHSTVKVGRNAQGRPTFEVSVRTGESDEIQTAADAQAEAVRLYGILDELLPYLKAGDDA
jgi:hypothetical protein